MLFSLWTPGMLGAALLAFQRPRHERQKDGRRRTERRPKMGDDPRQEEFAGASEKAGTTENAELARMKERHWFERKRTLSRLAKYGPPVLNIARHCLMAHQRAEWLSLRSGRKKRGGKLRGRQAVAQGLFRPERFHGVIDQQAVFQSELRGRPGDFP